jgi:hypothetical protein
VPIASVNSVAAGKVAILAGLALCGFGLKVARPSS